MSVCSSGRLKTAGLYRKLEEESPLLSRFRRSALDMDTTRSKSGYENILEQFETEDRYLSRTQMVTKGLDSTVSMVGIFNADRMIHFPDGRSYERAFQLITQ